MVYDVVVACTGYCLLTCYLDFTLNEMYRGFPIVVPNGSHISAKERRAGVEAVRPLLKISHKEIVPWHLSKKEWCVIVLVGQ